MVQDPRRGVVARHCYVWLSDFEAGDVFSDQPHPVVVISVKPQPALGTFRVLALAITHSPPQAANAAVEIPPAMKAAAGLDADRQWVVVNEANAFTWPGSDLRNVPGRDPPTPIYGTMPVEFLVEVVSAYLACRKGDPTGAREVKRP